LQAYLVSDSVAVMRFATEADDDGAAESRPGTVLNEAALEFYRQGWTNTAAGYFDAGTKYLQLADKASRTVALLTERLDQHRGRGQQQITVKHVTVNADQAVVADQIVSDNRKETVTCNLLTARTDKPMEIIEPKQNESMPVEGGGSEAE
jgi:hypothetical protein